jgi:hypothetical protein
MNTSATRRSWYVQHRETKRVKEVVGLLVGSKRPRVPLESARIVCTRRSAREPDYDNLSMSFKGAIDALVTTGVLVDDSPRHLQREYRWEKAPAGKGEMVMEVEGG